MNTIIELENAYTSGVYSKRPVVIVRGQGALAWDGEGREYIDCTAGYGVASIGHARPEIAAAIAAQAQRLITCPELFYNDTRAHLLERLAQLAPRGLTRFFLCNSGAEAVEGALKFARLATGRSGIVATLRGFHGRTMGALSTTWEPHYREPFAPLVPGVTHARYNDLAAAETSICGETAAVIIELVQGEGGVHVAREEYVRGLAQLCRERGAMLIIDEVQTGFGRTGRLFACDHYGLQPDILCLAKSLAGGVPAGAIGLGPRVMESGRVTRGTHGSSFGGNPLACAAALTALDIIEQENLPARAAALGAHTLERLRSLRSPLVRDVRGKGLLLGIELTRRAQPYLDALYERGVLALLAGPNVIRLLPPLVISEEQLDRALDSVADVLEGGDNGAAHVEGLAGAVPTSAAASPPGMNHGARAPLDQARQQAELSLLQQMLIIPSYSQQERALAQYLVEQARRMGLYASIDEAGNFVASTHPQAEAQHRQPIVLLGHMDTVRGHVPVRIDGGMLYGRGAVDAKGPLAAFICAAARLALLATAGDSMSRPVIIVGAVEEEAATSRGARAVVERYRPAACIIGEPSGSQAITIGYKGRLLLEYTLARAVSHSAGQQQNSSEAAIAFWNRVAGHAAAWNARYATGATHPAFASLMPSLRSINSSQDGLEERTRLTIGYRLPPGFDTTALRALLESLAAEDSAALSFWGEEAAFQSTRTTPLARAFVAAIHASGGQPAFKLKTGTSDMNVVGPAWGQNIVAYGPGDARLDHTPQEHVAVAEYRQAIDVLEMVLRELAIGHTEAMQGILAETGDEEGHEDSSNS